MRVMLLGIAGLLAGWAMPAAAQKPSPIRAFDGECSADSVVAGKPYRCNVMMRVQINPEDTHIAVIFAVKGGDGSTMMSLGGGVDVEGNLKVDGVQLVAGERTPFDGACTFIRKREAIEAVQCRATETGGDRREVRIDFAVTREVQLGK